MVLELTNKYRSAAELTGYVRTSLAEAPQNQFILNRFLPDTYVDDIDFRVTTTMSGLTRAAGFRSYDAESPITGRGHGRVLSGELPPISLKTRLGEYERLKLRRGDVEARIGESIETDGVSLAQAIIARAEIARGQALQDGKVTISENGLSLEADFGRHADHTQTAAQLWGTAEADPIRDLTNWRNIFAKNNGARPTALVLSQKALSALQNSPKVAEAVFGTAGAGRMVFEDQISALMTSLGLPQITLYDAQVEGVDGKTRTILDENKILFIGDSSKIGETLWGTTAEALDESYGIDQSVQPGIVVGSYSDNDPVALWTKASAVMLPTVIKPNATFSATVAG